MGVDPQPLILRDFLGLGKLVRDDPEGLDETTSGRPGLFHMQGLQPSSTNMELPGVNQPVCTIGLSMDHNFPAKKRLEDRLIEGTAESYGLLTSATQWQAMEQGTNTTPDTASARVLGSEAHANPNGTQLTIFYGGHVNVYDNISANKAQALMQMAANGTFLPSNGSALRFGVSHASEAPGFCRLQGVAAENYCVNAQNGVGGQLVADQASQNCLSKLFECAMPTPSSASSSPQPAVPKALPLARKASLARFLERRKERMQMMMPYLKKQFPATQGPSSAGQHKLGPFHGGVTLAKLFDEIFGRSSPAVFGMQEHVASHNGVPSCYIPAKE